MAQQLQFKHLSVLTLPSQQCYNIIQDKRGYIWISTDAGLCKYNGNSIRVFNKANELLNDEQVYFMEQNNDAIHLLTSKNRLLKLQNDSVSEEPYNKPYLNAISTETFYASYWLEKTNAGNAIVHAQKKSREINAKTGKVTVLADNNSNVHFVVNTGSDKPYFIKNKATGISETIKIFLVGKTNNRIISVHFNASTTPDWRTKLCKIGNTVFFNIHNKLIKVDENLNVETFDLPGIILSLYKDPGDGLWIGTFQKGVYYYEDVKNLSQMKKSLEDYSVTGTLVDHEGGVWLTTLEKGVFYCGNPSVEHYSNIPSLTKPARLLKAVNDHVFISTEQDHYTVIHSGNIARNSFGQKELINYEMTDVFSFNNSWYLAGKSLITITSKQFAVKEKLNFGAYQIQDLNGELFGIFHSQVFKIHGRELIYKDPKARIDITCFAADGNRGFLLGCRDGLYWLNIHTRSVKKIPGTQTSIARILKRQNSEVWIATKGDGLFRLKTNTLEKITLNSSPDPGIFNDLAEDTLAGVWAASNHGLYCIRTNNKNTTVLHYTSLNGLPDNDVSHLAICHNRVYASTNEGLCSFDLSGELINTAAPPVFLNYLLLNNKPFDPEKSELALSHSENSFRIGLDALTFKGNLPAKFMYRLLGQDSNFHTSGNTELSFDNLLPGTYKLTVYALNNDGVKSQEPYTLQFHIRKPFWQTLWFSMLCFLSVLVITFVIIRIIVRRIRHREEEKTRIRALIAESQLSALQAQMNPHFIFNAINSIQNYIMNNNTSEAYTYLAKFSKLIRIVLSNSRQNTITLHEELEMLKLYIELEQMRFKNSFDLHLQMDENINVYNIQLPVMLVQPYVENAIWHGLMNLGNERSGKLLLHFSLEKDSVKITVEDNGVGRERARAFKKENPHPSIAMQLTEQRLEMINQTNSGTTVSVTITDLYDALKQAAGTRIELYLPLIND